MSHSHTVPGQERFALDIAEGARFEYEGQELTISLVGEKEVVCTRRDGAPVTLHRAWLADAQERGRIVPVSVPGSATLDLARYTQSQLDTALQRQAILNSDVDSNRVCERTQRRWVARQNAALPSARSKSPQYICEYYGPEMGAD